MLFLEICLDFEKISGENCLTVKIFTADKFIRLFYHHNYQHILTINSILYYSGAHCADLHPINISEPAPEWLKSQWFAEMTIIQGWLADYNATLVQGAANKLKYAV